MKQLQIISVKELYEKSKNTIGRLSEQIKSSLIPKDKNPEIEFIMEKVKVPNDGLKIVSEGILDFPRKLNKYFEGWNLKPVLRYSEA